MTNGGFGSYLIMGNEWASHSATRRSLELFAEYVMPVFHNDSTARLRDSEQWCRGLRGDLFDRQATALEQAAARHQAEQAAKQALVG
jgi:limonene 1,2-monooxygenase